MNHDGDYLNRSGKAPADRIRLKFTVCNPNHGIGINMAWNKLIEN